MPPRSTASIPLRALVLAMIGAFTVLTLAVLGTPAHAAPSEAELSKQIDAKSKQFNHAVELYDRVQTNLKSAKKKIGGLQKKLDAAQAKVGKLSNAAYRGGKASALNSILANGSPSTLLDSLSTLDILAHNESTTIDTLNKATTDLQKAIDGYNAQAAKLKSQKASLDKQIGKLKALRTQLYGSATQTVAQDYGPPPNIPGTAGKAVDFAWAQLGKPYEYGAAGPSSYDCSGLTMASWNAAGYSLPHNTVSQWNATTRINRDDLQAGDLVFYYNNDHVAIYIGGGMVIHAPTYGEPVQKAGLDSMPINGYGRVT